MKASRYLSSEPAPLLPTALGSYQSRSSRSSLACISAWNSAGAI
jgi:hypothetical protein